MSDELKSLLLCHSSDDRMLSHKDLHRLANLAKEQQAENERLREELRECYLQLNEARDAGRRLVTVLAHCDNAAIDRVVKECPWLEVNDANRPTE